MELKITEQAPRIYRGNYYAIPLVYVYDVIELVAQYNCEYIIGEEISDNTGEHLQCIFHITVKDYNAMNKRIITKYKLRGRASKDGGRQYGTIKKLRNPERYKSYCVKDGKIHHNIDPKLIEEYISKSFKKKTTEIAIKISCREHIEAEIERYKAKRFKNRNNIDFMPLNDEGLIGYYAVKVSKFFRENGAKAPPSRSYVIYVLWKLEIISDQFYVSNILRL